MDFYLFYMDFYFHLHMVRHSFSSLHSFSVCIPQMAFPISQLRYLLFSYLSAIGYPIQNDLLGCFLPDLMFPLDCTSLLDFTLKLSRHFLRWLLCSFDVFNISRNFKYVNIFFNFFYFIFLLTNYCVYYIYFSDNFAIPNNSLFHHITSSIAKLLRSCLYD